MFSIIGHTQHHSVHSGQALKRDLLQKIQNIMAGSVIRILILISLIALSCSSRKNRLDEKNLIPEKELISLLTDIHITDGLLAIPRINAEFSSLDSITTYYQVIEKHGYTRELMDKTMKYYFINNPKKLNQIYDQVLVRLSELDSRVQKESFQEVARRSNRWPGKDFYAIPSLSGNDSTGFDITLTTPGIYSLLFTVTLYPDDQSVNPRAIIYTVNPDSIGTGRRKYLRSAGYIKDGQSHAYILSVTVQEKTSLHLRGWLFDFENRNRFTENHFKIENITLTASSSQI
jgi:hypothetical protein